MTLPNQWLYFGCVDQVGHYLWDRYGKSGYSEPWMRRLACFDGQLAPQWTNEPFVAVISRLGSYRLTALSFWDNTVDKRPGSNSILFTPSLVCSPETMLLGATSQFPHIWKRFPVIVVVDPPQ